MPEYPSFPNNTPFLTLCTVIFVLTASVSAQNSTYYPQYTQINQPNNRLPSVRYDSACTRAPVNVSAFALQESLLYNTTGTIDSVICFGGYNDAFVPDGTFLTDIGMYVVGGVTHTFMLNDINLFDVKGKDLAAVVEFLNSTNFFWPESLRLLIFLLSGSFGFVANHSAKTN